MSYQDVWNKNMLKYYEALDKAHTTGNYTGFVKLITKEEDEMLDRYLRAIGQNNTNTYKEDKIYYLMKIINIISLKDQCSLYMKEYKSKA